MKLQIDQMKLIIGDRNLIKLHGFQDEIHGSRFLFVFKNDRLIIKLDNRSDEKKLVIKCGEKNIVQVLYIICNLVVKNTSYLEINQTT